jgi:hypothetical protein
MADETLPFVQSFWSNEQDQDGPAKEECQKENKLPDQSRFHFCSFPPEQGQLPFSSKSGMENVIPASGVMMKIPKKFEEACVLETSVSCLGDIIPQPGQK